MTYPFSTGSARTTDPETSKVAAKIKRVPLRDQIIQALSENEAAYLFSAVTPELGLTGTELASALAAKLNSITPRFAELVKAGKIQDSGRRRDGQIVWTLTL